MPTEKVINIVNEEDKNEITIYVGVKPRIDTDIEFSFVHESPSGNKSYNQLDPSHVEAKAILLPKVLSKKEAHSFEDMDVEEYEFDIIYDQ